jgi:hypothetical protein
LASPDSKKQVSERTPGTGCSDATSGGQEQTGADSGDAPEVQLDMEAAYAMTPGDDRTRGQRLELQATAG